MVGGRTSSTKAVFDSSRKEELVLSCFLPSVLSGESEQGGKRHRNKPQLNALDFVFGLSVDAGTVLADANGGAPGSPSSLLSATEKPVYKRPPRRPADTHLFFWYLYLLCGQ
uniref:Uncharacterized protein n=1 Tax=Steinernema glaseri TaxID=37863 RepID=A0A1I8ACZ8_9BILA